MMNISIPKKRKMLEKPKKLGGVFDTSNDGISHLLDQKGISGQTDDSPIDGYRSCLGIETIGDSNKLDRALKVKDDPLVVAIQCREKGCLLAEEGRMSEALTKWQEGLFFCPSDHLLHELSAQGFLALDRNLLALKSAVRAVEICPYWTEGLLTLARTQREIGELETSFETYSRVLQIDMKNIQAIQEVKDLQPLLTQLSTRKEELLSNVLASSNPDEVEANTCILNLSTRFRVG